MDALESLEERFKDIYKMYGNFSVAPYSYSRLSTYKSCLTKFFFQYINEEEVEEVEIPKEWAEKGNYIHSVIDAHFKIMNKLNQRFILNSQEDIDKVLELGSEWIQLPTHFIHNIGQYNQLILQLNQSNKYQYIISQSEEMETEKYLTYSVNNVELFRGYIDAFLKINGKYYIFDWKTGKTKDYSPVQLTLYAFMLMVKDRKLENIELNYYLVMYDEVIVNKFTRQDIYNIMLEFLTDIESINKDYFYRKNNKQAWLTELKEDCTYCNFNKECQKSKLKQYLK